MKVLNLSKPLSGAYFSPSSKTLNSLVVKVSPQRLKITLPTCPSFFLFFLCPLHPLGHLSVGHSVANVGPPNGATPGAQVDTMHSEVPHSGVPMVDSTVGPLSPLWGHEGLCGVSNPPPVRSWWIPMSSPWKTPMILITSRGFIVAL